MVCKRKIAATAATFGAAMSAVHSEPELQADILDITWNGGNATTTNPWFQGYGDQVPFDIDQVVGTTDFNQWNDTFPGTGGDYTGRTIRVGNGRGILSATVVALGQSLDPSTFTGVGTTFSTGAIGGATNQTDAFDGSGTNYVGFRSMAGNVGWFKLSYTIQGPIIYSDGEYGSMGETVVVGGTGGGGFVPPSSYSVFRGVELSATLADFLDSDDQKALYQPGLTINSSEAPIWLIFDANAPNATSFLVESNAGTPGLTYTVEAWNWNTAEYDVIGTQDESFNNDDVFTFNVVPADHIDTNGDVRTRVGWRKTSLTINSPYEVRIDQVGWNQ